MPAARLHDIELAYEIRGTGPSVLFVAGTGYPGATWLPDVIDQLAERFTTITFDHRGTGDSPGTPGPYSTRQFAADALGLITALNAGPTHVVGHSMGGRVAQWMALDGPSRLRSLVLAASGPGQIRADAPQMRGIPLRTALSLIEHGFERHMQTSISKSFFTPEFVESNPATVRALVDAFWEHRPSIEDYLKHVIARQQHQTAELLPRIQTSTLVLIGDRDISIGGTGSHWEQSLFLAENLPRATLRVIPDTAHGYFWQKPQETMDALVEFFAAHS